MDHEATQQEIDALDEVVRQVAEQLPFKVQLEADMGGTFVLQAELGRRGGVDDPPDRATIDPGPDEKWWLDVEGGRESMESPFGRDADPAEVAQWITDESRRWGSPAALASADFPTAPGRSAAGYDTARPPSRSEGRSSSSEQGL